ncbi:MAG: hypothetical protein AB1705_24635 [Verrucomicrobiota bacterium]
MKPIYIILSAGLVVAGCGGKKEEPPKARPTMQSLEALQPAPPDDAPDALPPGSKAATNSAPQSAAALPLETREEIEEALETLNEALAEHVGQTKKFPASADELIKAGRLARLPSAPAGKKYFLDAQQKAFVLVAADRP